MKKEFDVAIIGLGPVGAILAGLLGKNGMNVVAIEKDKEVYPLPRAAHIDHTGLRTIQEVGCLDSVLPDMIRNKRLDLTNSHREVLARIPADRPSVSGLPTSVYFYQPTFDAELRNAAAKFPTVEIRLGTTMTGLKQSPGNKGVEVSIQNESAGEEVLNAKWLVGCDGGRSAIRTAVGIQLKSLNFDEKWLVLDLVVDAAKAGLPVDYVIEVCDPARPYLSTPISTGRQRFEFMLLPGEDPEKMMQREVIVSLLDAWIPESNYKIERAAVYTFHGVVAEHWRKGNIMLAGDAAHQTPPFLGQGMCAGFRDAQNLAWKLARVVKGDSPERLLDTYQEERAPHATKVIEAAIRIGKVICELDPVRAAERDKLLLANDRTLRKSLAFSLPNLERGALVLKGGGSLFVQPRVNGRYMDDIVGQRFLVLARSIAALGSSQDWWKNELNACVALVSQFDCPDIHKWINRYEAEVIVVRPDRYVLGAAKNLDLITSAVADLLGSVKAKSLQHSMEVK